MNEIEDSRKAKGKPYSQLSTLVIIMMAMLCGKTSLKQIARNDKRREVHVVQERGSKLQISRALFTLDALHGSKKQQQTL